MMQELGKYVVSLTAAALIIGILLSLFQDGAAKSLVRLVCGVFLTVTALSPLTRFSIPDVNGFLSDHMEDGQTAAAIGEDMARAETLELIKYGLEAYILDKAAGMNASITPEVHLDETGNPDSIQLTGSVSVDVRQKLEAVIANDLGIPREDQQWTG